MTLINLSSRSRKPIADSEILLAGPVRNASNHIANDIEKVLTSLGQFKAVYCFIVESDSSDDTLQRLEEMSKKFKNFSFITAGQLSKKLPKRTDRIAYARNLIIDAVASDPKYQNIDYVAMADLDGMNGLVTQEKIAQCWEVDEPWDVITANQLGGYYDIWALSIWPYCFSYNHFNYNSEYHVKIRNYITNRLNILKKNQLLPCISSFNGFSIYRTTKFLNTYYDGRIRTDLFSKKQIQTHAYSQKSKRIIYKDYGHIKGRYEDCEHRAFHQQARLNSGARIMISPEFLFY